MIRPGAYNVLDQLFGNIEIVVIQRGLGRFEETRQVPVLEKPLNLRYQPLRLFLFGLDSQYSAQAVQSELRLVRSDVFRCLLQQLFDLPGRFRLLDLLAHFLDPGVPVAPSLQVIQNVGCLVQFAQVEGAFRLLQEGSDLVEIAVRERLILEHLLQIVGHVGRALKSEPRIFLKRFVTQAAQGIVNIGIKELQERGFLSFDGCFDAAGICFDLWVQAERMGSGQEFVKDHAQREKVGPAVDFVAGDLLRGHVTKRPFASHGSPGVHHPCQAKVDDLDLIVEAKKDVARLDIAMDYALVVRSLKALAYLANDAQTSLDREPVSLPDNLVQRLSFEEGHDEIATRLLPTDVSMASYT